MTFVTLKINFLSTRVRAKEKGVPKSRVICAEFAPLSAKFTNDSYQIHAQIQQQSRANSATITNKPRRNHAWFQKAIFCVRLKYLFVTSKVFVLQPRTFCCSETTKLIEKSPHLNDHLPQAKRCFAACLPPLWYEHRSSLLRGQENKQQLLPT